MDTPPFRVYPHLGFDFAIPTTSSLISAITRGRPSCFRRSASVPLPRNEPSVPGQQRFRRDESGDFCQEFPAERLTLYREPTSLVVGEAKFPPAKPSFEDSVLLESVDDSGLLVTLDPTSHGDDQERPGLDRRAHDRGF